MRYVITFLAGAFVGAAAALLYAPSSGEELRMQIREGAEAEFQKAEAEWQKALADLSEKFDQLRQEIRAQIERNEALEEPEVEVEPAV